jgi:hypothetical protein
MTPSNTSKSQIIGRISLENQPHVKYAHAPPSSDSLHGLPEIVYEQCVKVPDIDTGKICSKAGALTSAMFVNARLHSYKPNKIRVLNELSVLRRKQRMVCAIDRASFERPQKFEESKRAEFASPALFQLQLPVLTSRLLKNRTQSTSASHLDRSEISARVSSISGSNMPSLDAALPLEDIDRINAANSFPLPETQWVTHCVLSLSRRHVLRCDIMHAYVPFIYGSIQTEDDILEEIQNFNEQLIIKEDLIRPDGVGGYLRAYVNRKAVDEAKGGAASSSSSIDAQDREPVDLQEKKLMEEIYQISQFLEERLPRHRYPKNKNTTKQ